jgi:hypothetical protein
LKRSSNDASDFQPRGHAGQRRVLVRYGQTADGGRAGRTGAGDEIGTTGQDKTNIYYVGGRTAGQMGLSRVIGPKTTIKELYKEYGDVCKSCNNTIELQLKETDCCQADTTTANGSEITYTLKHVVLIQVGIQIGAQDMMINEQSSLMFSGLDYT